MKGIPNTERQRLGALLDHETQETVMAMIPQFSETEIGAPVPAPAEVPGGAGPAGVQYGAGRPPGGAGRLSSGLPGRPAPGCGAGQ